jgi:hypothetical protein
MYVCACVRAVRHACARSPGAWRMVLELPADGGANVSTPPREWPVAYLRGDLDLGV